jgi:replicative DNA helicase
MEELQKSSNEGLELKKLGFQPITKAVEQTYAHIREGINGNRKVFPTKWPKLNRALLGGLQPSKLYVIGGRPGVGKSAFSNQLIFDLLDHPKNQGKLIVLYWSFEMPAYQQLLRIGSAKTGKSAASLLSVENELDDLTFKDYVKVMDPYKKYPVYFNSNAQVVEDMAKIVLRVSSVFPDKTIINLFDHSRLFKKNKEDSELIMLTNLSHKCIELQQSCGCINIILSQLNRNIEKAERIEQQFQPMLSDLFGADSIGQDKINEI